MNTAPIVLFTYNRPLHTQKTVTALGQNTLAEFSDLYVYSDAARDRESEAAVRNVRAYLRTIRGFRSVTLVEQQSNLGLANSIISGVTAVCERHGAVIVVEDDLITSRHFLSFMNEALAEYADDIQVGSVHGYWYPTDATMEETFFLRGASCWGWATWSRAWRFFERDGAKLLNRLRAERLTGDFDLDGAMAYTRMLEDQIAGRNNSWAIRWHASTYLEGMLQLSPGRSLVRNIGFDGSGTHCDETEAYSVDVAETAIELKRIPLVESRSARAALIGYHRRTRRPLAKRIMGRLRRLAGIG